MRQTLHVYAVLLHNARKYARVGRPADAISVLERILRLAKLPQRVAFKAHLRAGELHLNLERFRRAKRHLREAVKLDPTDARARFLFGLALERDPSGDSKRAWFHLRVALKARPGHAPTLAALGRLAFRLDRGDLAVRLLRRAHRLAPDCFETLESLADVLTQLDKWGSAERTLSSARFRLGKDTRFGKLWDDFRFDMARERLGKSAEVAASALTIEPPVLLAFPAVAEDRPATPVRRDAASNVAKGPHFHKLSAYRLKQRRAR